MNLQVVHLVDTGVSWLVVLLAITGYFLTLKRIGEKWPFWMILASGWALLALANTLVVIDVPIVKPSLTALWLSSYLLIMVSLLLIFLKLTNWMKARK